MSSSVPLTIVMPVYNGQKYLRASLDSVLAQTYRDYELVIWDDGSVDGTAHILDSYTDPRIRRFSNRPNKGLFPTLNLALSEARGERIRLWAQDDRMRPRCLEREDAFWEANPRIGMSCCRVEFMDAEGHTVNPCPPDTTPEIVEPWLAAQLLFYHGCITANISTITLRKDLLLELGGFGDFQHSGDFDVVERVTERYPFGTVYGFGTLVDLRLHQGQLSNSAGACVAALREDRRIRERLFRRLPPEIQEHARNYRMRNQRIKCVHYAIKELLRGRWRVAAALLGELPNEGNPLLLFYYWLISGNGRWGTPRPLYREPTPSGLSLKG